MVIDIFFSGRQKGNPLETNRSSSNKWLYYETNVFCSVHWLPKSASLSECMCVCVFVYMQIEIVREWNTDLVFWRDLNTYSEKCQW